MLHVLADTLSERPPPPGTHGMLLAMGLCLAAFILAGLEVAVVQATVGAIVGEYLGGDKGLGRYAVDLQNALQIDKLYGAILIMTIFGFVLYSIVTAARRLLIPWHDSVRSR